MSEAARVERHVTIMAPVAVRGRSGLHHLQSRLSMLRRDIEGEYDQYLHRLDIAQQQFIEMLAFHNVEQCRIAGCRALFLRDDSWYFYTQVTGVRTTLFITCPSCAVSCEYAANTYPVSKSEDGLFLFSIEWHSKTMLCPVPSSCKIEQPVLTPAIASQFDIDLPEPFPPELLAIIRGK